MNRLCLAVMWFVILSTFAHGEFPGCLEVEVDSAYEPALRANEHLVQWGGVDTLTLKNGVEVLVGVGQVRINTGDDFLVWRRVAELKASRSVAEFLKADMASISTLVKNSTTTSEEVDGELQKRSRRVEKFLSSRIEQRTKMAGRIKTVGHWTSADGKYGYLAVSVVPLDK
jgi:hypothetical protein